MAKNDAREVLALERLKAASLKCHNANRKTKVQASHYPQHSGVVFTGNKRKAHCSSLTSGDWQDAPVEDGQTDTSENLYRCGRCGFAGPMHKRRRQNRGSSASVG